MKKTAASSQLIGSSAAASAASPASSGSSAHSPPAAACSDTQAARYSWRKLRKGPSGVVSIAPASFRKSLQRSNPR